METRQATTQTASTRDDSHLQPHVHSTHRNAIQGQGQGQGQGPWKRYQLKIDNGRPTQLVPTGNGDDGSTNRSTLDPEIRAGCVPATAYPSFRTMPPPSAAVSYSRKLPRVSS